MEHRNYGHSRGRGGEEGHANSSAIVVALHVSRRKLLRTMFQSDTCGGCSVFIIFVM